MKSVPRASTAPKPRRRDALFSPFWASGRMNNAKGGALRPAAGCVRSGRRFRLSRSGGPARGSPVVGCAVRTQPRRRGAARREEDPRQQRDGRAHRTEQTDTAARRSSTCYIVGRYALPLPSHRLGPLR